MTTKRITQPATEPISLADAKLHCRVDHSEEDTLLTGYIAAVREYAEDYTGRAYGQATFRAILDGFPPCIELKRNPVVSVESIEYHDGTSWQPFVDYVSDLDSVPARIVPKTSWPIPDDRPGNVRVNFTAGADPGKLAYSAMLLLVGHFYENRSDNVQGQNVTAIPLGANRLLDMERIY